MRHFHKDFPPWHFIYRSVLVWTIISMNQSSVQLILPSIMLNLCVCVCVCVRLCVSTWTRNCSQCFQPNIYGWVRRVHFLPHSLKLRPPSSLNLLLISSSLSVESVGLLPGMTESTQTGAWPRSVKPKFFFPRYTRMILGNREWQRLDCGCTLAVLLFNNLTCSCGSGSPASQQ